MLSLRFTAFSLSNYSNIIEYAANTEGRSDKLNEFSFIQFPARLTPSLRTEVNINELSSPIDALQIYENSSDVNYSTCLVRTKSNFSSKLMSRLTAERPS